MTKLQVFYSFHYRPDNWRAAQVRNIGAVERNRPASGNDWESVAGSGGDSIKNWVNVQMENRVCTVVLVGSGTANREWINYEIAKSWERGMGVVGIRIHGLKDANGHISQRGDNPFDYIDCDNQRLSAIVKCYNPQGANSQARYAWIKKHIFDAIEEAIEIRSRY